MAADFLQSNLFTPSVPSERILKETRKRKQTRTSRQFSNHSTDFDINKNKKLVIDHHIRRGLEVLQHDIENNLNDKMNKKETLENNSVIFPPLLNSVFSDGLVAIPSQPQASSSSSSRRERIRRRIRNSFPIDTNMLSSTKEVFVQRYNVDLLASSKALPKEQTAFSTRAISNQNKVETYDHSELNLNVIQRQNVLENLLLHGELKDRSNNGNSKGTINEKDSRSISGTFMPHYSDFEQTQGVYDIISAQEKKRECTLSNINARLFQETIGQDTIYSDKNETNQHINNVSLKATKNLKGSIPESFVADKSPESNDIGEKHIHDRKKLLHLLHALFRVRWRNRKEDEEYLVGEGPGAYIHPSDQLRGKKRKAKKKKKLDTPMPSLQQIFNKLVLNKNKGVRLNEPTLPTKKKKRIRRKNFLRAGQRLRSSLGYGCRYIGHGLANMTTIIPEASYMDQMNQYMGYNDSDYVPNDYYDPNSPEWDCHKGPYVRRGCY